MQAFFDSLPIEILFLFFIGFSFLITFFIIPRIILLVRKKKLMDNPNSRSSHKQRTPTMGGIAFFASLISGLAMISHWDFDGIEMIICVELTLLFYIGVIDDLLGVRPKTKILAQIVGGLLIAFSGVYISSFNGFLGIQSIPLWTSYLLSLAIVVVITNAYNLIDGINGLAATIGSIIFAMYAFIFYFTEHYFYMFLAGISIGTLTAFARYNISRRSKNHIFMGDTGSMIIGLLISLLTIKFLSLDIPDLVVATIVPYQKFSVVIAILFIPLFDTARVFLIRLLKHGKPFTADRNHIHHIIIDYTGLGHRETSSFIGFLNILIIFFIYGINRYVSAYTLVAIIFGIVALVVALLFYLNKSYNIRKKKRKIRRLLNQTIFSDSKLGGG